MNRGRRKGREREGECNIYFPPAGDFSPHWSVLLRSRSAAPFALRSCVRGSARPSTRGACAHINGIPSSSLGARVAIHLVCVYLPLYALLDYQGGGRGWLGKGCLDDDSATRWLATLVPFPLSFTLRFGRILGTLGFAVIGRTQWG